MARRLEQTAGAFRRPGGAARLPLAPRRRPHPLPRARRAECAEVDERLLHEPREGQAVVRRLLAAARAGLEARHADDPVGPGAAAHRSAALPPAAVPRRAVAMGREDDAHDARGLPAPRRPGRARLEAAALGFARPPLQHDRHRHVASQHARRGRTAVIQVDADPRPFPYGGLRADGVALLLIDMQRDFLEPGGYLASMGYDVELVRSAIGPARRLLDAARDAGLTVIHTRQGFRPDLGELPPHKLARVREGTSAIGKPGPLGRFPIRGEAGFQIVPELEPAADEPVVDKSGNGAFWHTDLASILAGRGVR